MSSKVFLRMNICISQDEHFYFSGWTAGARGVQPVQVIWQYLAIFFGGAIRLIACFVVCDCLFVFGFHLFVSLPLVWGVQPVLVLQLDWSSFVPWSEKHKYVIALVYCPLTLRYFVLQTDIEIQMCHCYCAVHWHWDTKTLLLCLMTLRHWNTDVSLLLCSRLTLRHWRALLCPVTLKTGSW